MADSSTMSVPRLVVLDIKKSFGAVRSCAASISRLARVKSRRCWATTGRANRPSSSASRARTSPTADRSHSMASSSIFAAPAMRRPAGIETVYQDLALCDNLDVVANLFLGRERRGSDSPRSTRSRWRRLRKRRSTNSRSSFRPCAARSLSCQAASANRSPSPKPCLWAPKVVILDEPTAALGVAQQKQVLDLIKRLREAGLAVVVITHNVVDVFAVADVAIVMRLGQRVAKLRMPTSRPRISSRRSPARASSPKGRP